MLIPRHVLARGFISLLALAATGCSRPQPGAATPQTAAVPPAASAEAKAEPAGEAPLGVTGKVLKVSAVPQPGAAPYTECLTYIKYKVLSVDSGRYPGKELLAVYWGMRDNELMPAARFEVGEVHRMKLEPFSEHPELQRVMAADDTDEYELTPYWVVEREEP